MRPTVVVSGFGPWAAARQNPTLQVLELLRRSEALSGCLATLELPVESAAVGPMIAEALDRLRPALWIGLGLAAGASVVAVERVAANILDFSGPDIAGVVHDGAPVFADGPAAYLASVPVKAIVRRLRAGGVPARVSNSASTFLCNQMMYTVLHLAARKGLATQAGFLHIPAHPALVASWEGAAAETPSMAVELAARAVELAVETALGPGQGAGIPPVDPLSQH